MQVVITVNYLTSELIMLFNNNKIIWTKGNEEVPMDSILDCQSNFRIQASTAVSEYIRCILCESNGDILPMPCKMKALVASVVKFFEGCPGTHPDCERAPGLVKCISTSYHNCDS